MRRGKYTHFGLKLQSLRVVHGLRAILPGRTAARIVIARRTTLFVVRRGDLWRGGEIASSRKKRGIRNDTKGAVLGRRFFAEAILRTQSLDFKRIASLRNARNEVTK
jgi:hypothetical protein